MAEQSGGTVGKLTYLGRYMLGQSVPLAVRTLNDSGTPTNPTLAPYVRVYDSSGFVKSYRLPIRDKRDVTGVFQDSIILDGDFSAGHYNALVFWVVGSTSKCENFAFEVVAGGNGQGQGIGMYYYRHPAVSYLLFQCENGRIKKNRNPRVV